MVRDNRGWCGATAGGAGQPRVVRDDRGWCGLRAESADGGTRPMVARGRWWHEAVARGQDGGTGPWHKARMVAQGRAGQGSSPLPSRLSCRRSCHRDSALREVRQLGVELLQSPSRHLVVHLGLLGHRQLVIAGPLPHERLRRRRRLVAKRANGWRRLRREHPPRQRRRRWRRWWRLHPWRRERRRHGGS